MNAPCAQYFFTQTQSINTPRYHQCLLPFLCEKAIDLFISSISHPKAG